MFPTHQTAAGETAVVAGNHDQWICPTVRIDPQKPGIVIIGAGWNPHEGQLSETDFRHLIVGTESELEENPVYHESSTGIVLIGLIGKERAQLLASELNALRTHGAEALKQAKNPLDTTGKAFSAANA